MLAASVSGDASSVGGQVDAVPQIEAVLVAVGWVGVFGELAVVVDTAFVGDVVVGDAVVGDVTGEPGFGAVGAEELTAGDVAAAGAGSSP